MDVTSATDPAHDGTNWQLNSSSDAKTNDRVASALSSPKSTITSAAPTGNVASDALASVVPAGTSASIQGNVVAGRGVHVRAKDNLTVNGIAGSIAVGFVGVGAAILIMNVDSATEASIAAGSSITAGASGSGDVTVEASMNEDVSGLAFSGTGGVVAVGAQVIVLNDTGSQNAHIDNGAAIHQAGGGVFVTTTAIRTIDVEAIGVGVGAGAIGAAVAVSDVSGDASATIGNVLLGDAGPVAGLSVTVNDSINAPTKAISVQGGIGAGLAGAIAFSTLSGTTSASSGAHGTVGSGGVTITATGNHTAKANTVNVATGAFAAGVTVAHVSESRATLATDTSSGNIVTSGDVLVAASATNEAEATAPGGAAGGVTIDILVPIAEVSGDTNAQVDGSFTGASSITVRAHASNHADAEVEVIGVSVIGISGAFAHATVSGNVEANVGSGATLDSTGAILVEAELVGPNQATAEAHATAGALGGIAGLSVMDTQATVSGDLIANLGGNVTNSSSITVRAQGANTATANTAVFGIAAFTGQGGGAGAEIDGNTNATSGSGSWTSSGLVLITATSNNNATASSDIGAGGLFSIGISLPSATVNGGTTAELAANVDPTAVEVHATSDNDATATSEVVQIGIFGQASGTVADATIGTGAVTNALIDASSTIAAAGAIEVLATSDNNATANIPGGGGGLISVNIMVPTALVEGATKAHLDGDVTGGTTLLVRSRTSNTASATSHVVSIGVLGGGVGITSDAEVTAAATSEASVGSTADVVLSGNATIQADQTADNSATATANGTSTGLISGGIYQTKAIVAGAVLAAVDGSITSAGLTVNADGDNTAVSTTTSFGIGGISFSGAGALAQITSAGDVTARTGSTASAHGPVSVTATSLNTATAKSDAASGGLAFSLAVNMPTAKVGGATLAQFNGDADNATSVVVQATSANTATATADIFSAGLIGSGAGASSDAEITSDASTQALVGSTSSIEAPGVGVLILATSASHATAVADGSSLGLGASISVMIPTANVGGLTKASFDGDLPGLSGNVASLTVRSRTSNQATANAHVVSISLGLGGAGGDATAIVGSSADNEASIGQDAVIVVTNGVTVDAGQTGANLASATIDGGAGGAISGVFMGAESHVGGAVLAQVDGNVTADSLTITANGSNTSNATTSSRQISALGFSGAGTLAEITSGADVTAGTGSTAQISTTHAITVSATSHNSATSISDAASGGLLGAISINLPTAIDNGGTLTEFDGDVSHASSLTVQSTATNTATATAQVATLGGLISGAGASSDAEIGSSATTAANVGQTASLIVPSGPIQVLSTSTNHADATASGFSISFAVSVAVMNPTARVGGATTADFDGDIPALPVLHRPARDAHRQDADVEPRDRPREHRRDRSARRRRRR